ACLPSSLRRAQVLQGHAPVPHERARYRASQRILFTETPQHVPHVIFSTEGGDIARSVVGAPVAAAISGQYLLDA
ncbi:hypothetical protein, partial [Roseomonas marmotae]|uniref:hypothetical protein n=1 Tax=Roseomonas marmotae TaxID=2768161 RepID=UPI001A970D4F